MSELIISQKLDWCSQPEMLEKIGKSEAQVFVSTQKNFSSDEEVLAYCRDLGDPEETIAVPMMVPKLPNDAIRAVEKAKARAAELDEKIKGLATVDENGQETWRIAIENEILTRNQQAKSKTKGCQSCGSSVATAYIRTLHCPICGSHDFLITETDSKKIEAKESRIKAAKEERDAALKQAEDIERTRLQESTEFKRIWAIVTSQG